MWNNRHTESSKQIPVITIGLYSGTQNLVSRECISVFLMADGI